jgi:hypothetical protein
MIIILIDAAAGYTGEKKFRSDKIVFIVKQTTYSKYNYVTLGSYDRNYRSGVVTLILLLKKDADQMEIFFIQFKVICFMMISILVFENVPLNQQNKHQTQ